eukprot:CAMPEP_0114603410 /NCGR_PEP_ID=MMETSP0168-20121206/8_1 /TAXON_ID=95228 ORGANISM="Vannella sp., Strain DIVA3 517/6/12" /NCGR_SAMPLE_ID=MMETSP0168 /ASSEMBLY_ACC=CAM_ASM_000044 /LENGTH=76 /DNA_ID=CAMNT_0001814195 /DNA_START=47 /DNA_END=277 /DNA_ORIENTATION=+
MGNDFGRPLVPGFIDHAIYPKNTSSGHSVATTHQATGVGIGVQHESAHAFTGAKAGPEFDQAADGRPSTPTVETNC